MLRSALSTSITLTDRRYSEDEVAKILEAATEVQEAGDRSLGSRLLRLPRWADTRERQMEEVPDRLVAAVSATDRPDKTISIRDQE